MTKFVIKLVNLNIKTLSLLFLNLTAFGNLLIYLKEKKFTFSMNVKHYTKLL